MSDTRDKIGFDTILAGTERRGLSYTLARGSLSLSLSFKHTSGSSHLLYIVKTLDPEKIYALNLRTSSESAVYIEANNKYIVY